MALKPSEDLAKLEELFPYILEFQKLASKHGIRDVFQDNGGKILQLILITGFKVMGSREGNDAIDSTGNEVELKTANVLLVSGFSTHHHLNLDILAKYRKVDWYFAIYRGIIIDSVYRMSPEKLEPYFKAWEDKWRAERRDINNPKIPIAFVIEQGTAVYQSNAPEVVGQRLQDLQKRRGYRQPTYRPKTGRQINGF